MDVGDWRKKIDELDAKLVELLNDRSRCAAEIGKLKRKDGEPIFSPRREREILDRVQKLNRGPLGNEAVRRLFERILDEARVVEKESYEEKD